jgi:hypothetical protein
MLLTNLKEREDFMQKAPYVVWTPRVIIPDGKDDVVLSGKISNRLHFAVTQYRKLYSGDGGFTVWIGPPRELKEVEKLKEDFQRGVSLRLATRRGTFSFSWKDGSCSGRFRGKRVALY